MNYVSEIERIKRKVKVLKRNLIFSLFMSIAFLKVEAISIMFLLITVATYVVITFLGFKMELVKKAQ